MHANASVSTALVAIVQQAMSETGLSQKAFAINAEQSQSVVSEAFNGRRTLALGWLWAQDDVFLLRFFELAMKERRLTPEHASAIRRRRIVELMDLLLQECA